MRSVLLFLFYILSGNATATAQRLLGVATGRNNITQSMYINPASIGGCDEKYIVPIFSVNALIDNNLGRLSSIGKLISSTKSTGGAKSIFEYNGNTKFSMLAPMVEIQGPGIIKSLNEQHTLAFTTRLRLFNEFYNFDKLLFAAAINALDEQSVSVNMKNFKWTVHTWSEAGLSYGGVFAQNEKSMLKIGVRLNLLGGIGYVGLDGKNLDLKYLSGVDSMEANNAKLQLSSSIYGSDNISSSQILGNIFGGNGRGFGIDAGLIYILRKHSNDDRSDGTDASDHKVALSLSVTDLGAITYNKMSSILFTGSGYISSSGLSSNAKSFSSLNDYFLSRGYKNTTATKADLVYLPTAVTGSIDYNFNNGIYTNIMVVINIASDYNLGNKYFTQITATPRYDSKIVSFGMPVTYNTLTKNIRLGAGIRYGSVFIGSDDALLFFMSHQYGFNFYCGGYITVHKNNKASK